MIHPMTCKQYLRQLDEMVPSDEDWNDPEFVYLASWMMLMFLPRRLNQKLIDAGYAQDKRGWLTY